MGCRFGKHNYWYSQGAFRCKKCGYVTYKSHRRKNHSTTIILTSIIIAIGVIGYFAYQTYGTTQIIPDDTKKVFNNTGSTIQRLYSQSQQSISNLQTTVTSSINQDNRVPIVVYKNCHSVLRTDQKIIGTTCGINQISFKFIMPDSIEQSLPNQVPLDVKTDVYRYGATDFKIGLYDQIGEKNYTVTLWQFPQ